MDPEELAKLIDDISDQTAAVDEMANMLADMGTDEYDPDIEDEYNELVDDDEKEKEPEFKIPEVPKTKLEKRKNSDVGIAEEMRMLEAMNVPDSVPTPKKEPVDDDDAEVDAELEAELANLMAE